MSRGPNYNVIENDWRHLGVIIADLSSRIIDEDTSFSDYILKDGSRAYTGTGAGFKDEDNMSSDSAVATASQQSVKAYVDAQFAFGSIISTGQVVEADSTIDSLTLTSANDKLTIVGTAATDTILFTVNEGNIDHGSLAGLGDDDHTHYLLASGARALAGNWDLGGKNLTNGGSIAGTSLTDGTATLSSGSLTGIVDIGASGAGVINNIFVGGTIYSAGIRDTENILTTGTIGTASNEIAGVYLADSAKVFFGDDQDFAIYHSGVDAFIDNDLGELNITSAGSLNLDSSINQIGISGNDLFLSDLDEITWSGALRIWHDTAAGLNLGFIENVGTFSLTSTTGQILIKPDGDTDDYIEFSTTADVPQIRAVGSNLSIIADSGEIDFDNENLTTSGTLDIGETTVTGDIRISGQIAIGKVTSPSVTIDAVNSTGKASMRFTGNRDSPFITELEFWNRHDSGSGVVQNDDFLMIFQGRGYDGVDSYKVGANINFKVDGTPSPTSMPTEINFSTTPVGSTSVASRLRITPAGHIIVWEKMHVGSFAASATHDFEVDGESVFGDGTNETLISATGVQTMTGDARVWISIDLEPALATRPVANPPSEGIEDGFQTHDFSPTTDESVFFHLELSHDYADAGLIHVHFDFFVDTAPASAESVVWGVEYKKQSTGDNFDFSAGTTTAYTQTSVTTGTPANDKKVHESSEISLVTTGFVAGDYILLRLFRDADGTGGTDDFTDDARVIDYHIEYISDKLGEAL